MDCKDRAERQEASESLDSVDFVVNVVREVHKGRLVQPARMGSSVLGDSVDRPAPLETLETPALQVHLDQLDHQVREEIRAALVRLDLLDLLDCRGHLDRPVTEDHRDAVASLARQARSVHRELPVSPESKVHRGELVYKE